MIYKQPSIQNTQQLSDQKKCNIDDHWYEWMMENFLNGFTARDLIKKVNQINPPNKELVISEIKSTETHPLLNATRQQYNKLKRREWLIDTLDSLTQLDRKHTIQPDVITAPKFDVFVEDYYSKNKPVVLREGIKSWPALKKWNPSYMKDRFGDVTVEIQYDREQSENYEMFSPNFKKKILMREYVDLVVNGGKTNNYYITGNNTKGNLEKLKALHEDIGDFGQGYRDIEKNHYSNLFWFGPKGSFTPLHFDTFNIILTQVYGRKRITLIPPSQASNLYNDIHVYSKTKFPDIDLSIFPKLSNIRKVEIILYPGEALFIPIGWWHCVEGIDISMSVSFTNFNIENDFFKTFPKE